jgi:shikimate kinase
MNIILTGFMGTGKSSVGRALARDIGLDFIDTDELIEERENRIIAEIFERSGEPYFRDIEEQLVRSITSSMDGVVLSTGGGIVINPANMELLANWGVVVLLSASVDEIIRRVGNTHARPLIDGANKRHSIEQGLKDRRDLYSAAEFTVLTDGKTIKDVVEEVKTLVLSGQEKA